MKISELIQKLQEKKNDNGDMEVALLQHENKDGIIREQKIKIHHVESWIDLKTGQVNLVIY